MRIKDAFDQYDCLLMEITFKNRIYSILHKNVEFYRLKYEIDIDRVKCYSDSTILSNSKDKLIMKILPDIDEAYIDINRNLIFDFRNLPADIIYKRTEQTFIYYKLDF